MVSYILQGSPKARGIAIQRRSHSGRRLRLLRGQLTIEFRQSVPNPNFIECFWKNAYMRGTRSVARISAARSDTL